MAIQVQNDGGFRLFTFVHDAQVMVVRALSPHGLCDCDVRTFDFSQRGRSSLPLRGGAGGTQRKALYEDGVDLEGFEPDGSINPWYPLQSLSDGRLFHMVSFLAHYD